MKNQNIFGNVLPLVDTENNTLRRQTFNEMIGSRLYDNTNNLIRQFYTIPPKKDILNFAYFLYSKSIDSCKNSSKLCQKYTDLRFQV